MCDLQLLGHLDIMLCRWKYSQTIIMDGNFVSEHLKSQNPDDDVPLSDGHGFMVTSGPYKEHLKAATDTREVCDYNHC